MGVFCKVDSGYRICLPERSELSASLARVSIVTNTIIASCIHILSTTTQLFQLPTNHHDRSLIKAAVDSSGRIPYADSRKPSQFYKSTSQTTPTFLDRFSRREPTWSGTWCRAFLSKLTPSLTFQSFPNYTQRTADLSSLRIQSSSASVSFVYSCASKAPTRESSYHCD